MHAFVRQLFLLSLSGTLSTLLICILKKLYQKHFSRRWQYYIWLVAVVRFLLPFAPDTEAADALLGTGHIQTVQRAVLKTDADFNTDAVLKTDAGDETTLRTDGNTKKLSAADNGQAVHDQGSLSAAGSLQAVHDQGSLPAAVKRYLPTGILMVWLIPALFLFIRKITASRSFRKAIASAGTAVSDVRILQLFGDCLEACGVKKQVELYQIPQLATPVMAGMLRPCIAIPDGSFSDKDLSFIFLHELTHYKRYDLVYKWLIQAVVCVHWFNPAVYFLEKEVNSACELACDESVIRFLPKEGKKAYGDTLLLCSKTAYLKKSSVPSLTLTEGAQQLKERLGAIMKFRQLTKKTKIATMIVTVFICFGSAVIGAYAAPSDPADTKQADMKQADAKQTDTQNIAPSAKYQELRDAKTHPYAKYQELLAFRTDHYQEQTVAQFREKVTFALDTPKGMQLLDAAFRDEEVHLHCFDQEEAFFLQHTLILASGTWRKNNLSSVGVERPLKNGQAAELEFRAQVRLLNQHMSVWEYEEAYRGLADTAAAFLASKTEDELMDTSRKTTKKLSKEALKAMQAYAGNISKKGDVALTVDFCSYAPEEVRSGLPAKIKKLLTLKTKDYKNYTLQQFFDYVTGRYVADEALWKASQGYGTLLDEQTIRKLSEEEYTFLAVTLPCTISESTDPHDRVGSIPPGFGGHFDLPYEKHGTKVQIEWHVQYEIQNPKLTVGERDKLILNVINRMDEFVKRTPDTADIGTEDYTKSMRAYLKQLVKENSGSGLKMTVFQCG